MPSSTVMGEGTFVFKYNLMQDYPTLYILFNSKTRQLACFTFDISVFPEQIVNHMLIKSYSFKELGITDDSINLNRFKWLGDFDSGSLVDIVKEKKAIVTEKEIVDKYHNMISSKYSLEFILHQLILNSDMKTDEGVQMQIFVDKVLKKKKSDIEYFKNSPLHIWEAANENEHRRDDAFKT